MYLEFSSLVKQFLSQCLFCFLQGTNGCGELGLGKSSEQEETPCIVDFEGAEGVCFASAGGSHTALLVSQCVYTCGNNDKGQLGRRTEGKIDSTLKRVELQGCFQQVAAGWEFTLAKTDAGEVWCWGSNQFGQLGSADKVKMCHSIVFKPYLLC